MGLSATKRVKITVVSVTALLFLAGYLGTTVGQSVPVQPPIGEWPLSQVGAGSTPDISPSANAGILNNNPLLLSGTSCPGPSCLSLDGTQAQFVVVPQANNGLFTNAGDMTVCIWAEPNRVADGQVYVLVDSEGQVAGRTQGWIFEIDTSGKLWFQVSSNGISSHVEGKSVLAEDTWGFFCGQRSGSTLRIFVNGTVDGTNTDSVSGPIANPGSLLIGASHLKSGFFYGALEDMRVYAYSLSPDEIRWLYAQGP